MDGYFQVQVPCMQTQYEGQSQSESHRLSTRPHLWIGIGSSFFIILLPNSLSISFPPSLTSSIAFVQAAEAKPTITTIISIATKATLLLSMFPMMAFIDLGSSIYSGGEGGCMFQQLWVRTSKKFIN